jgi:DNA polymerase-4
VAPLGEVQDDIAILGALGKLWDHVVEVIPPATRILRVSVTLGELTLDTARQPDLFPTMI